MAKTNFQNEVIHKFNQEISSQCEKFILLALESRQSVIMLPVKNENNEQVLHSDNTKMMDIMNFYLDIARVAVQNLPEKEQENLKNKYPGWKRGFDGSFR